MQIALDWRPVVGKTRPRKPKKTQEGFGPRLARLRRARGLTQEEFGQLVGISNRMVAYYERSDARPPGQLLPPFATALRVSTDELLGLEPSKDDTRPRTARLLKRLRKIEELPPADQRALLKMLDALLQTRHRDRDR